MSPERKIEMFLEVCNCQDEMARTIRSAWISGTIDLSDANELSEKCGIAGPLTYWAESESVEGSKSDKDKEPTIVSVIKDLQYILQIKPTERTEDEIEDFRTQNNFVDGSFQGYTGIGPE